ncbi:cryptochrome/photolyase family protein, partial [Chloroflexi bacterium]|nr:cryptochrome/photolyase family protein [Chloroflexota bacterium]
SLDYSYVHHIERLMILGNFMLLLEIHPKEIYKWFMEVFIDAYPWVMVSNIFGMSQFSDGGLMSTKPYISSSNYVIKMSNYKKGEWSDIWDALFWNFINKHKDKIKLNPRMGMMVRLLDKKSSEEINVITNRADTYLSKILD